MRLLELQRQRRQEAGDRDVAVAQQRRGAEDAAKFAEQATQAQQQARHTALTDLAKAQADSILRREEVTKATQRSHLQQLTAPVDGTVQQLILHTIGGVVQSATNLMIIVPDSGGLEVEARLLNRDAGFVHLNQTVAVKFDAYPFTRYGTIAGTITGISRDTVIDPKLGPVYVVRIDLVRNYISVDERNVLLNSGLIVTADVRTGSRSIVSFMLSPLKSVSAQAGRER